MSGHIKGKLELCSDSLGLAQIEGKTIFVVFPSMCNTPEDLALRIANSKELVRRWNAFEEGHPTEFTDRLRSNLESYRKYQKTASPLSEEHEESVTQLVAVFEESTITIENLVKTVNKLLKNKAKVFEKTKTFKQQQNDLLTALESFVDDEVCRFDHHGYCQTHGVTNPCRTQTARDIIGRIKEAK